MQTQGVMRPLYRTVGGQHTLISGAVIGFAPVSTKPSNMIVVPPQARNIHIQIVGRGTNSSTPPSAFAFNVVSWEQIEGQRDEAKDSNTLIPVYQPIALAIGTATFGSAVLNGIGATDSATRGFLTEIDFVADAITTTVLVGESSLLSPGSARPAILSLDCRGARLLGVGIASPATGGNVLYRFW